MVADNLGESVKVLGIWVEYTVRRTEITLCCFHTRLCCYIYLQLLSDRIQAIEAQINSLRDSAASSDDCITNVVTKYKAICTAVDVSAVPPTYLCVYINVKIYSEQ